MSDTTEIINNEVDLFEQGVISLFKSMVESAESDSKLEKAMETEILARLELAPSEIPFKDLVSGVKVIKDNKTSKFIGITKVLGDMVVQKKIKEEEDAKKLKPNKIRSVDITKEDTLHAYETLRAIKKVKDQEGSIEDISEYDDEE